MGKPFGPRSRAAHRVRILGLGLSASIAFAAAGCDKPQAYDEPSAKAVRLAINKANAAAVDCPAGPQWKRIGYACTDGHNLWTPKGYRHGIHPTWVKSYGAYRNGHYVATKCYWHDAPLSCAELDRREPTARD